MTAQAARPMAAGFSNEVFDSQSVFRRVMEALASTGRIRPVSPAVLPDAPLMPSAAAVILSLCDFETPLWLSAHLSTLPGAAEFLRFHTGAPLVPEPSRAAFAVVDLRHDALDLASFAQGTAEYPDRSATIIALCDSLEDGPALTITGPGIATVSELRVSPSPADLPAQWSANRARFPLGVDIVFASHGHVVGLPRSARILGEAG